MVTQIALIVPKYGLLGMIYVIHVVQTAMGNSFRYIVTTKRVVNST